MPTSPFIAFDSQYSAHTDVTMHPITGVVYITVAFHPNNTGGYNCRIWELPPPYTGKPTIIRDWVQGQYSVSPFGHGASIPLPNGALLTVVPVGATSAEVAPSLFVDPNVVPPFALGEQGGADPRVDALMEQVTSLQWQINMLETALQTVGTGDYPASDRELVDRLRKFMRPLLGA